MMTRRRYCAALGFAAISPLAMASGCRRDESSPGPRPEPRPAEGAGGGAGDDSDFIGLTPEQGEALAKRRGLPWRVTSRDGESLPVTMDYLPERVNFEVVDGAIVSVRRG